MGGREAGVDRRMMTHRSKTFKCGGGVPTLQKRERERERETPERRRLAAVERGAGARGGQQRVETEPALEPDDTTEQ